MSLRDALFKTKLTKTAEGEIYHEVTHGKFYKLIQGTNGLSHLAWLIRMLCQFLKTVREMGINYGNLRAENVLIKFARDGKRIESIKLINFGCVLVLGEEE